MTLYAIRSQQNWAAAHAKGVFAAEMPLMSVPNTQKKEKAIMNKNLKRLTRIVLHNVVGCDPKIMGIGAVPAIQQTLQKDGLALNDMHSVEINEAFAAQTLVCAKKLT